MMFTLFFVWNCLSFMVLVLDTCLSKQSFGISQNVRIGIEFTFNILFFRYVHPGSYSDTSKLSHVELLLFILRGYVQVQQILLEIEILYLQ